MALASNGAQASVTCAATGPVRIKDINRIKSSEGGEVSLHSACHSTNTDHGPAENLSEQHRLLAGVQRVQGPEPVPEQGAALIS